MLIAKPVIRQASVTEATLMITVILK